MKMIILMIQLWWMTDPGTRVNATRHRPYAQTPLQIKQTPYGHEKSSWYFSLCRTTCASCQQNPAKKQTANPVHDLRAGLSSSVYPGADVHLFWSVGGRSSAASPNFLRPFFAFLLLNTSCQTLDNAAFPLALDSDTSTSRRKMLLVSQPVCN